jgi:transposase
MADVRVIGLDIAKSVFQLHGIDDAGSLFFHEIKLIPAQYVKPYVKRQKKRHG